MVSFVGEEFLNPFAATASAATAYLVLSVDDMVPPASTTRLFQQNVHKLQPEFAIKDMGPLWFFLGIDVRRDNDGFFLSQEKYAKEILERAGMSNCKAAGTPMDVRPKASDINGNPISDASWYRRMVGALQYLTLSRLDIAYAMQQVCLHMHHETLIWHCSKGYCATSRELQRSASISIKP